MGGLETTSISGAEVLTAVRADLLEDSQSRLTDALHELEAALAAGSFRILAWLPETPLEFTSGTELLKDKGIVPDMGFSSPGSTTARENSRIAQVFQ